MVLALGFPNGEGSVLVPLLKVCNDGLCQLCSLGVIVKWTAHKTINLEVQVQVLVDVSNFSRLPVLEV